MEGNITCETFFMSTQKCNFYQVFFHLLIWSNWQWKYLKSASSVLKSWKVDEKTGVALELPLCVITWTAAGLKWPCRRSGGEVEEKWSRVTFTFLDGNMSNIVKQNNYSLEFRVFSRGVFALSDMSLKKYVFHCPPVDGGSLLLFLRMMLRKVRATYSDNNLVHLECK